MAYPYDLSDYYYIYQPISDSPGPSAQWLYWNYCAALQPFHNNGSALRNEEDFQIKYQQISSNQSNTPKISLEIALGPVSDEVD